MSCLDDMNGTKSHLTDFLVYGMFVAGFIMLCYWGIPSILKWEDGMVTIHWSVLACGFIVATGLGYLLCALMVIAGDADKRIEEMKK